ncbi:MAG: ABC transporter permease [candidate division WOR-3 bacterium]
MRFKLITGSLLHRPLRFLLVILALSISLAFMSFLLSFGEGLRAYVRNIAKDFQPFAIIQPKNFISLTPSIPISLVDSLKDLGFYDIRPVIIFPVVNPLQVNKQYFIVGLPVGKSPIKYKVLEGRDLKDNNREALIGDRLKEILRKNLGDSVFVGSGIYKVVGVIRSEDFRLNSAIIVPINEALEDFNIDKVNLIAVNINGNKEKLELLRRKLNRYDVLTAEEILGFINTIINLSDAVRFSLSLVSIFVSIIFLFAIMMITVHERNWEFALFRALGMGNFEVFRIVIMQSLTLGIVSWVLSIPISLIMIFASNELLNRFFGMKIGLYTPKIALISLFIAIIAPIIGGILPARNAMRVNIRESLGK